MILSTEHQFSFIHNPKSAGTTIRSALTAQDSTNNYFWGYARTTLNGEPTMIDKAHIPIYILEKTAPNAYDFIRKTTCIIIVRHPIKRLFSAFKEWHAKFSNEFISVDLFRQYCENRLSCSIHDYRHIHALPQYYFCLNQKKMISDVEIKLETPDVGLQKLREMNNIAGELLSTALAQGCINKRDSDEIEEFWHLLSPKLKNEIENYYRKDFLLFEYETNF